MGHTFINMTFEQLRDDVPAGSIVHDSVEEHGIWFVIVRGPGCLCAYLGVPKSHPVACTDGEEAPIEAHWGLTFSGTQHCALNPLSEDTYWYGWDYGHCDDATFHYTFPYTHGWTVEEVIADSQRSIQSLVEWMVEAEQQQKAKPPAKALTRYAAVEFVNGRKFREE